MIVVRGCTFPQDRYYHAEYNVWVKPDAAGNVVLGATSFGIALAGELFAFMPKPVGTVVETGKAVGLLEIMKAIIAVRSPLAGTIVAVNESAVGAPAAVRADPYEAGWLVKLGANAWTREATAELVTGAAVAPAFEEAMRLEDYDGSGR